MADGSFNKNFEAPSSPQETTRERFRKAREKALKAREQQHSELRRRDAERVAAHRREHGDGVKPTDLQAILRELDRAHVQNIEERRGLREKTTSSAPTEWTKPGTPERFSYVDPIAPESEHRIDFTAIRQREAAEDMKFRMDRAREANLRAETKGETHWVERRQKTVDTDSLNDYNNHEHERQAHKAQIRQAEWLRNNPSAEAKAREAARVEALRARLDARKRREQISADVKRYHRTGELPENIAGYDEALNDHDRYQPDFLARLRKIKDEYEAKRRPETRNPFGVPVLNDDAPEVSIDEDAFVDLPSTYDDTSAVKRDGGFGMIEPELPMGIERPEPMRHIEPVVVPSAEAEAITPLRPKPMPAERPELLRNEDLITKTWDRITALEAAEAEAEKEREALAQEYKDTHEKDIHADAQDIHEGSSFLRRTFRKAVLGAMSFFHTSNGTPEASPGPKVERYLGSMGASRERQAELEGLKEQLKGLQDERERLHAGEAPNPWFAPKEKNGRTSTRALLRAAAGPAWSSGSANGSRSMLGTGRSSKDASLDISDLFAKKDMTDEDDIDAWYAEGDNIEKELNAHRRWELVDKYGEDEGHQRADMAEETEAAKRYAEEGRRRHSTYPPTMNGPVSLEPEPLIDEHRDAIIPDEPRPSRPNPFAARPETPSPDTESFPPRIEMTEDDMVHTFALENGSEVAVDAEQFDDAKNELSFPYDRLAEQLASSPERLARTVYFLDVAKNLSRADAFGYTFSELDGLPRNEAIERIQDAIEHEIDVRRLDEAYREDAFKAVCDVYDAWHPQTTNSFRLAA